MGIDWSKTIGDAKCLELVVAGDRVADDMHRDVYESIATIASRGYEISSN